MLPWSVGGVTDLPPDAKLSEMQQNADRMVQFIGAATPDVPNQTPMPQPSKRLLNACRVPPMEIIVTLLAGCQSAIVSSNEWQLKIETMTHGRGARGALTSSKIPPMFRHLHPSVQLGKRTQVDLHRFTHHWIPPPLPSS